MSEQNILNPNGLSEMSPDYAYSAGLPQMHARFQAKSGFSSSRQLMARGRIYDLAWGKRLKATADALRQWEAQYRNDFFTFYDVERSRYFSGIFAAPIQESPAGNDQWNLRAQFVELPGLAMYAAPTNWFGTAVQDSIFLEDRDGFGNNLVKLTGAWVYEVNGLAHGGTNYYSANLNDTAEWFYFGYGFRFWSIKDTGAGIVAVSVDGGAETNVDLYNAVNLAAAALTTVNLPLGFHRVKLRVTHTKNAGSTGYYCRADAIEVMQ